MEIEEVIKRVPGLEKVTPEIMIKVSKYKMNIDLDLAKTFGQNGFDDLDCVEFLMELEKILDISIPDDICEHLFSTNTKPPQFIQYNRNKKIEQLGL
jgi:acyl carrier protein